MSTADMEEPLLGATSIEMEGITTKEEEEIEEEEESAAEESPVAARLTANTPCSLAQSPTTPTLARILIPLCIILTHMIFLYGQFAQMWRLRLSSHVNAWANTTSSTSRMAFDTLGLPHQNQFFVDQDEDVETFTYMYAVRQLWRAKGLSGTVLPRVAAVLLVLFSGVWPHLKLLLLTRTWLASYPTAPQKRTRTLHWLSALGKWSLADVLAVCVMVGVLNLDWEVQPADIKAGLVSNLPQMIALLKGIYTPTQVCTDLLKFDCKSGKFAKKAKCSACKTFIYEAMSHPDWVKNTGNKVLKGVSTSGGGTVQLRVLGMRGIYAFCGAVVLSVLLSLLIDVFDLRARRARQVEDNGSDHTQETCLLSPASESPDQSTNNGAEDCDAEPTSALEMSSGSEAVLGDQGSRHRPSPLELQDGASECAAPRASKTSFSRLKVSALVTVVIVTLAVNISCMERRVYGAFPILLHDILGIEWKRTYSLRTLMARTTDATSPGWDYLLIGTFSLFVVFGPVLRAVLCVVGLVVPLRKTWQRTVKSAIDFIGAFCAWEVFVCAMFMVDMLMPSITNTIYNKPSCGEVSEDGSCLKVEFVFLPRFLLIVVGGVMLLLTSSAAVKEEEEVDKPDAREDMAYMPLQDEELNFEVLEQQDSPEIAARPAETHTA